VSPHNLIFFSGNDNVLMSESDSVENVGYNNWIDLSEGGYYHKTLIANSIRSVD